MIFCFVLKGQETSTITNDHHSITSSTNSKSTGGDEDEDEEEEDEISEGRERFIKGILPTNPGIQRISEALSTAHRAYKSTFLFIYIDDNVICLFVC